MTDPLPITIIIPVKNEERNLAQCIQATQGCFHEIFVIDSGSTDATVKIAKDHNATVLDFQWNGRLPKKRNWALKNISLTSPWVLFLDADEYLTPKFIEELRFKIDSTTHVGFYLNFRNWFAGQPMRHGDPFRKVALFRVDAGEYERFPEDTWCHLDMEVHEHPILNGTIGEIKSPIDHRDFRGFKHYIGKHNEYSTWEAQRFSWLRSASPSDWHQLTSRQKFKYRNLDRWWLGLVYFFVSYVLKGGFLDGSTGLLFNRMKLRYFGDIRLKIRELDRGVKVGH